MPASSSSGARHRQGIGLVLSAVCAACAPSAAPTVPRANLITGSTGSSWYSIGSAVADRANALLGGRPLSAVPGAGGVSNPARVARLPGDLGISFGSFLSAAYRGQLPYRQAYPELRHVATLIENKLHLVVADRLGVADVAELVRRRVAARIGTGPPGSGEEFLLRELLAFYGASYDDLRRWGGRIDLLGTGERGDAWGDGHLDVIVFSINDPAPAVTELLASRPGRMVSVDAGAREALARRWHALPRSIPAGSYPGQERDVETLALAAVLFTTADVPEETVYAVARGLAENKPYLETVHAGFKRWEPRTMAVHSEVPLHEGAARLFREKGWIVE